MAIITSIEVGYPVEFEDEIIDLPDPEYIEAVVEHVKARAADNDIVIVDAEVTNICGPVTGYPVVKLTGTVRELVKFGRVFEPYLTDDEIAELYGI